ncbi:alpha-ribazole phosphatase/probable phosphoglycerate mutase [Streptomyces sp. BK022]|uniref:histidine phosphatase family protein n=1 Tax=Streptomyces sp. BK022 TaxID=2512123 RepID=UPI0010297F5D|nr:histidine phosphatase family protein [Streptomyces sp. BK022]RZU37789.1 alpha-ribazole phosphatase/probable phosphoglycerate mutase [Streptomyces sp. BK022]
MTSHVLTVVRHAPTESNGAKVFMGCADVPATAEGLRSAASRAPVFRDLDCAPVFASPLSRAWETAAALFPDDVVRPDPRLVERDLGEWAGQPQSHVRAKFPQAFLSNGAMDPRFTPPGGETLDAFEARIRSFLQDAAELGGASSPAAVSHNGWIRTAHYVLGMIAVEQIFAEGIPFLEPIDLDLRPLTAGRVASR